VKNLIPRVGLSVAWGPPKCGKSFWAFDLMMHVALGWDYRGRRVHQGPVVYCAFEGQTGVAARAEAFRKQELIEQEDVPFYLEPVTLDLVRDHKALIAAIKQQLGDAAPVAVTLDTLNRSLRGSESSDEDMSAYVNAADAIRETFGCAVLIVHHCGVEGTRPRGHTSLTGACDAQLAVQRSQGGTVTVTVECMKDGTEGDVIAFRLERVEVGVDDDGEDITSCIVVPLDAEEAKAATARQRRRSPKHELAARALAEALAEHGTSAPASWGLPSGVNTVVALDAWRAMLLSRGVLDKESDRRVFWNLRDRMKVRGIIAERDGQVWLVA
jgi:AAA domain-containing protein